MKTKMKYQKKRLAIALAVLSFPALIGCGKRDNTSTQQGGVNNAIYPVTPAPILPGVPGGTCAPLTGPIGFTGTGVYVSYANIRGGQIPGGMQQVGSGQVIVGGPGGSGPYQVQTYEGTSVSMSVDPINTGYPIGQTPYQPIYPQNTPQQITVPGQANVNGFITLSQLTISNIQYQMGGMMGYAQTPYTTPYTGYPYQQPMVAQNLCVIGLGMDIGHYGTRLYGGNFYLYFSNGQVYPLPI